MCTVSLIAYILLGIVSAIHLYGTYNRNKKLRRLTKWLLLPLLVVAYVAQVEEPNLYFVFGFIFYWAGDVLLLIKGTAFFTLGGVAFALGHVCLISAFIGNIDFRTVPYLTVCPLFIIFTAIINMVRNQLKDYVPKVLQIPMVGYLLANAAMNVFAILQMFSHPSDATITISLGALLFLYSDITLFGVRFHRSDTIYKRHFIEMLSYIVGEALICYGFMIL